LKRGLDPPGPLPNASDQLNVLGKLDLQTRGRAHDVAVSLREIGDTPGIGALAPEDLTGITRVFGGEDLAGTAGANGGDAERGKIVALNKR